LGLGNVHLDHTNNSSSNNGGADDDMKKLICDGIVQPCPNCGAAVMTSGGCNHVVCSACSLPFIWNKSGQSSSAKQIGRPSSRSLHEWLRILALCLLLLLPLTLWAHHELLLGSTATSGTAAGEMDEMQKEESMKKVSLTDLINTVTAQYLWKITKMTHRPAAAAARQYDWCGVLCTLSCIGTTLEEIQLRGSAGTLVSAHGLCGLFCFVTFYGFDWFIWLLLYCVEWILTWIITQNNIGLWCCLLFLSLTFLASLSYMYGLGLQNWTSFGVTRRLILTCILLATAWFVVLYPSGMLSMLWGMEWYIRRPAHALMTCCFALVHAGPRWRQMVRNWIHME
jgi:hypothetical protein